MAKTLLAHGGTAGLAVELAFLVVPILIFGALALFTGRKRDAEETAGEETDQ